MDILKNDLLEENIKSFQIHGLKVYVFEKKEFSDISASFVINYGSNDISFKSKGDKDFKKYPLGIAHFLEHKMFDGEGTDDVFKKFSDLGADVNAYTSNNVTNYYFSTVSNFDKALKELCNMIYNLNLTDEKVTREKPIIEQELKMYDDDPYNRVYRNLLENMYGDHPVRHDIGGDVHTIKLIEKCELEDCYNTFYANDNMFLVIVGNIDSEYVLELLNNFIENKRSDLIVREEFRGDDKILNNYIEDNMNMSVPTNLIGFKDMNPSNNYIKKFIIFEIIHRMFFRATSGFYEEIYKSEIIDNSYYTDYINEGDYGYYIIGGDGDRFREIRERFFKYYEKYDFNKDVESFNRVKKAMYGNYVNLFNSVDNISQLMVKLIHHNSNLFDYFSVLSSITLQDVVKEFKAIFKEENLVYSRVI